MKFVIDSHEFPFGARVIENLSYDVILGRDFLKEFCFKVDFENGSVNFLSEPDPLPFKGVHLKDDSDSTDKAFISSVHASRTFCYSISVRNFGFRGTQFFTKRRWY